MLPFVATAIGYQLLVLRTNIDLEHNCDEVQLPSLRALKFKKENTTNGTDQKYVHHMSSPSSVLPVYSDLIGNTELLQLSRLSSLLTSVAPPKTKINLLVKLENRNPSGTCKDRVALGMLTAALHKISLSPHPPPKRVTFVEGTSGSTGISLSSIISNLPPSLPFTTSFLCVCPSDMSVQKRDYIVRLGADLLVVDPRSIASEHHYVNVARRRANEINAKDGGKGEHIAIFLDQFSNDDNWTIHYNTTGPEIHEQLRSLGISTLDGFIVGAGTGGTIVGVGSRLKQIYPNVQVVLADPQGSVLANRINEGIAWVREATEATVKRKRVDTFVEGIGCDRVTAILSRGIDRSLIDSAVSVTDQHTLDMADYLLSSSGLFVGGSSGVHVVAAAKTALQIARQRPNGGIITVLTTICDSGDRHLSRMWSKDYIEGKRGLRFPAAASKQESAEDKILRIINSE